MNALVLEQPSSRKPPRCSKLRSSASHGQTLNLLAAEILADAEQEWHRVERRKSEEILSLYTTLSKCLHRHVKVEDLENDCIPASFKVHMVEVVGVRVFWGYNPPWNVCVLFKPLASVVLTASLEMAPKSLPWQAGGDIMVHITNVNGATIFERSVPCESHMYQIGKAVGKAAQELMKLTNVEVQHAKVILAKSSKQWVLHGTIQDMFDLDSAEEAGAPDPEQEGDRSQKIPVSKHHLKK